VGSIIPAHVRHLAEVVAIAKVLDLNSLIADTSRMLNRVIGDEVELTTDLSPNLGLVKIDSGQFVQVIINMAINARDAMPQGGKLRISTKSVIIQQGQASQLHILAPGKYVAVTIADTGAGMTEEVKAHLFEPFFTTKELGKGTGLGLSTCYGIIRQAGGHIEVASEPGQGAAFTIYLPTVSAVAERTTDAPQAAPRPPAWETVLLVEDDPNVRKFVGGCLRLEGYEVIEAVNGVEALSVMGNHPDKPIHVLVTDVAMPRMGGQELAQQLQIAQPGVKVLFISGHAVSGSAAGNAAAPGTDVLLKPFLPDVLARKIRELLDKPDALAHSVAAEVRTSRVSPQ